MALPEQGGAHLDQLTTHLLTRKDERLSQPSWRT